MYERKKIENMMSKMRIQRARKEAMRLSGWIVVMIVFGSTEVWRIESVLVRPFIPSPTE